MMDADNVPALGGEKRQDAGDCAPMLGGDRAVMVPCKECGGDTIRDFFGNWICLDCIAIKHSFESKGRSSECAWCRHKKLLPLLHDEFIREFPDLESGLHYPDVFYGAYWCQRCFQCHFVYRENNRLRVVWIDADSEEFLDTWDQWD